MNIYIRYFASCFYVFVCAEAGITSLGDYIKTLAEMRDACAHGQRYTEDMTRNI